jgi:hypothetical protein
VTDLNIKIVGRIGKSKWALVANAEGINPVVDEVRLTDRKVREEFAENLHKRLPGLDLEAIVAQLEQLAEIAATPVAEDSSESSEAEVAKAAFLVSIALKSLDLVVSHDGQCYAIPKDGPYIANPISTSSNSLGGALMRGYWDLKKDVISASTLQNAISLVKAFASQKPKVNVYRRVAWYQGAVVLDLADDEGRCVIIDASGWRVADRAPVVFARTELRGVLPVPEKGGQFELLGELVNFEPDALDLAIGWLLAALLPGVSTPIGLLGGQQGTGKTTAARYMCLLVDPSPAPVRSAPKDVENWCVTAQASWVIVLDNISKISDWFSDALCKAATGEAMVRRTLYADSAVSVFTVHNPVLLTSIDPGDLRGDLLDRICYFDLEPIAAGSRRRDAQLSADFEQRRPKLLGALLDLLVEVLRIQASVKVANPPRLADFAHLLACIDEVRGTHTLQTFCAQRTRAARDAVESSALGQLLVPWYESLKTDRWSGTAREILELLKVQAGGSIDGIRTERKLAGELRRLVPSLKAIGIEVTPPTEATRGGDPRRKRTYSFETLQLDTVHTVHIGQTDQAGPVCDGEEPSVLDDVDGMDGMDGVDSTSDFEGGGDSTVQESANDSEVPS